MNNLIDPNNIPEYLRQAFEQGSVGSSLIPTASVDKISIRGGVFRCVEGGQEVATNTNRAMNFVIVTHAPSVSRSYYANEYDADKKEAPTCWSSNANTPDESVPQQHRQYTNCAQCPQNQEGSGKNGSRACRFMQRIAVALPDRLNKVYAMTIPATSLWGDKQALDMNVPLSLSQYSQMLHMRRVSLDCVVTEFRFDTDAATPMLRFRAVSWLTPEQISAVRLLATSEDALEAITFNVVQREVSALPQYDSKVPAAAVIERQPTISQQPIVTTQAPVQVAQTSGFTAAPANGFGQPTPSGFGGTTTVNASFGSTPAPTAEKPKRTRAAKPAVEEPANIPEPVVVDTNQAAAAAGTSAETIQDLLAKWS